MPKVIVSVVDLLAEVVVVVVGGAVVVSSLSPPFPLLLLFLSACLSVCPSQSLPFLLPVIPFSLSLPPTQHALTHSHTYTHTHTHTLTHSLSLSLSLSLILSLFPCSRVHSPPDRHQRRQTSRTEEEQYAVSESQGSFQDAHFHVPQPLIPFHILPCKGVVWWHTCCVCVCLCVSVCVVVVVVVVIVALSVYVLCVFVRTCH